MVVGNFMQNTLKLVNYFLLLIIFFNFYPHLIRASTDTKNTDDINFIQGNIGEAIDNSSEIKKDRSIFRTITNSVSRTFNALKKIVTNNIFKAVTSVFRVFRNPLVAAVSTTITAEAPQSESDLVIIELDDGEILTQEIVAGEPSVAVSGGGEIKIETLEKKDEVVIIAEEKPEQETPEIQSSVSPIILNNLGNSGNISGSRSWKVRNLSKFSGKLNFSFTNILNKENGCNDQELMAEPNCKAGNTGELGRKMLVTLLVNGQNYSTIRLDADVTEDKIPAFEIKRQDMAEITLKWFLGENNYGNEISSDSVNFNFNIKLSAI